MAIFKYFSGLSFYPQTEGDTEAFKASGRFAF
jgi:hypothetical protein